MSAAQIGWGILLACTYGPALIGIAILLVLRRRALRQPEPPPPVRPVSGRGWVEPQLLIDRLCWEHADLADWCAPDNPWWPEPPRNTPDMSVTFEDGDDPGCLLPWQG